jgi:hypothetical protein
MVLSTSGPWWRGAVVVGLAVAGVVGAGVQAGAASSAGTTTSFPLTLTQWKTQYEPAIGQLADDVVVVVNKGIRDVKHLTEQEVRTTVTACRTWHSDAEKLPAEVPPIPLAAAEKTWKDLIAASISGSSDCTAALQQGSRPATKDFQGQVARVDADEGRLVTELGTSTR